MPGVGEQHNSAVVNPYEVVKPHVSEYTAVEIATLASRLEKKLGPEYIASRPGPGGSRVSYLPAHKCIGLANEVFGFNGWSSCIQNIQVDFVDENEQGRVSLGVSVTLRVTLRDGVYHEDIGYGSVESCKGKATAFENAKKEATTDALKRTLKNFGNVLGNCLYDKDYLAKVSKLKAGPTKWDPGNLHRDPDFASTRKETSKELARQEPHLPDMKQEILAEGLEVQATLKGNGEDEFGSDDFDAVDFAVSDQGHPDEVMLEASVSSHQFTKKANPSKRKHSVGSPTAEPRMETPHDIPGLPPTSLRNTRPQTPSTGRQPPKPQPPDFPQSHNPNPTTTLPHQTHQSTNRNPQSNPPPLNPPNPITKHEPPVGFFTARAAESLQAGGPNPAIQAPLFNPHLESPSIRKTAGVDHTRTKPVNREFTETTTTTTTTTTAPPPLLPLPPPQQQPLSSSSVAATGGLGGTTPRTNTPNNHQTDHRARRVGMPVGLAANSPLQNRGSYKPPQMMKRPAPAAAAVIAGGGVEGVGALRDVTAASINAGGDSTDVKRQKVGVGNEGGFQNHEGVVKV